MQFIFQRFQFLVLIVFICADSFESLNFRVLIDTGQLHFHCVVHGGNEMS